MKKPAPNEQRTYAKQSTDLYLTTDILIVNASDKAKKHIQRSERIVLRQINH